MKQITTETMNQQIKRQREYVTDQEQTTRAMTTEGIRDYLKRADWMLERKRGGSESVYQLQQNIDRARAELQRREKQPTSRTRRIANWLIHGPK